MHFNSVLLPLPLRPTIPKNSPWAISREMSLTACSSSYSVERNGCSARSFSVEYCWWGSRKVLLTFSTEIAAGPMGAVASGMAAGRVVMVDKVNER